jgi:cation diffusion facilitator CzcD-associated flavoprotein CzcO
VRTTPILIIGSGFSGLGLAIQLRLAGREDFVILEKANDVGGTWRENTYPGCACDIQSHLYSFSFAPNPNWSRAYSPQPEILDYLRECASKFDVRRFVRFGCHVRSLRWNETTHTWTAETSEGEWSAQAVVMATGPLSEPSIPLLPGLASFKGPVFHSAEWDPSFDAHGKRVAIIGNGASAVQFIPILQKQASRLVVFQRTAAWVVPRPNPRLNAFERLLFRYLPVSQLALRSLIFWAREIFSIAFRYPRLMKLLESFALRQLAKDVPDAALRAKLTPKYTIGCKRILLSNDYWPALAKENVDVVTDGIIEIRALSPSGGGQIVTRAGEVYDVDALIFATGFRVTDSPLYTKVFGRGQQTLADSWQGSPRAYLGMTSHGFPNLFFLLGPNTGLGHTSVVLMIEAQIAHAMKVLNRLRAPTVASIDVRQDVQDQFVLNVDREMTSTVWMRGGCKSWYLDRTGRNSTIWPKTVVSFQKLLHSSTLDEYEVTLK